jgi:hypothetical protein
MPLSAFHKIKIASYGFNYRVYLNGAPVYNNENTSAQTISFPIQHWIMSGDNLLTIIPSLSPEETQDPETSGNFQILVETIEGQEIYSSLVIDGSDVLGFKDNPEKLQLHFSNRTNVSPLIWQKGESIKNDRNTFERLFTQYETAWRYLNTKNVDGLLDFFKAKTADMASIYNWTFFEYNDQIRKKISEKLLGQGNTAWPINREYLTLKIDANSKLASLETPDGNSPLVLFNEEEETCHYFDALFYIPIGLSDFVIIR